MIKRGFLFIRKNIFPFFFFFRYTNFTILKGVSLIVITGALNLSGELIYVAIMMNDIILSQTNKKIEKKINKNFGLIFG